MTNKYSFFGLIVVLLLSVSSVIWFYYESHVSSVAHNTLMAGRASYNMEQAELARDKANNEKKDSNPNQSKTIPQSSEEPGLIREIGNVSLQSGVQLQSLTFGSNAFVNPQNRTVTARAAKTAENVQIIVSGTTKQLLNFIDSLQSNSRLSIVNNCDLSNSSKTQMSVQIDFPYTKR